MNKAVAMLLVTSSLVAGADAFAQGSALHGRELPSLVVADTQFGSGGFPGTRSTTAYTYDENGQVLREVHERDALRDGLIDFRSVTVFTYDLRGNPVSQVLERDFLGDSRIDDTETTTWTYDDRGLVVARVVTSSRAPFLTVTTSTTGFEYDASGQLVKEVSTLQRDVDPDLDRFAVTTYRYNEQRAITSSLELVFGDAARSPLAVLRTYVYDTQGNLVRSDLAVDDAADGTVNFFSVTEFTFDKRLHVIEETTLSGSDAHGVVDLVQRTTRSYDQRGDLLREERTFDQRGDGSIEYHLTETFTHDEAGRLIATTSETDLSGDGLPDQRATTQYFY